MIQRLVETKKVNSLFQGWHDTLLRSCMQGIMGEIYGDDRENPHSAFVLLGDYCLLAGEPSNELLHFQEGLGRWETRLLVPKSQAWEQMIRATYGSKAKQFTRYALKKEASFDKAHLGRLVDSLSPMYRIVEIDEILYHYLLSESWSHNLVSQFPTYERFRDLGLGFVILKDAEVVAGASTYCRYHNGIEVEVDTKMPYRRKGLALACSAKLILSCLERDLFPSWDAHTEPSLHLAEKLGYELDYPYEVFEITKADYV
ncbi:MAG: GNAT family N-acetyltransferase [Spirochaetaceae bacterium]|nr:GNAT family N-acetyltransferase [Spirochaetaceae bacterium]MDN5334435.1 hypothetical protein [Sphaerochaeta sp.]